MVQSIPSTLPRYIEIVQLHCISLCTNMAREGSTWGRGAQLKKTILKTLIVEATICLDCCVLCNNDLESLLLDMLLHCTRTTINRVLSRWISVVD